MPHTHTQIMFLQTTTSSLTHATLQQTGTVFECLTLTPKSFSSRQLPTFAGCEHDISVQHLQFVHASRHSHDRTTHPLSTDTATGCTNTLSTQLRFTCFLCNNKCKRKGILTHLLSTLATYIILSAQRISSLLPACMSCRLLRAMSCVMMKVWRGSHICSQATHGSPG